MTTPIERAAKAMWSSFIDDTALDEGARIAFESIDQDELVRVCETYLDPFPAALLAHNILEWLTQ